MEAAEADPEDCVEPDVGEEGAKVEVEDAISSFEKELDQMCASNRAKTGRREAPYVLPLRLTASQVHARARTRQCDRPRAARRTCAAAQVTSRRVQETGPRDW